MQNENPCNGEISLPISWKTLIYEFVDADDVKDGKDRHNLADPKPYYDDSRKLSFTLENGKILTVCLFSGQMNYWGAFDLLDENGSPIYESEPLEKFPDLLAFQVGNVNYNIRINWN